MPYAAWYSLFMICAGLTLPRTSGKMRTFLFMPSASLNRRGFADYSLFYYFVLWFTLLSLSILFILAHGMDYVAWPRLIPLDSIIYYDGPGFRSAKRGQGFGARAFYARAKKWPTSGLPKSCLHEIEMGSKEQID
jgi:phosphatidylinositol 4-phosphatase